MRLNRLSIISLAALLGLGFASCERKYDAPLLSEPTVTVGEEGMITIAQYKEKYKSVPNNGQLIEENFAIRGVVVGNDISGNIYKQIYVQDATGGISIGIDQNNISNDFQVGQEVFIKLQGLAATSYGGVTQIGMMGTQSNRIPYEIAKEHILKDKWPNADNAQPKKVSIGQLTDAMVGTLIELENVYFELGGTAPYADQDFNAINRNLKDTSSNTLYVRNSKYATFANDIMPKGNGTVVGILSKFNNDYQLFIRSAEDCYGFSGKDPVTGGGNNNGTVDPTPTTGSVIYSEDFAADLGKMTPKDVAGAQGWRVNTQYKNANMAGFASGASHANEDWLVSPAFDLSAAKSISISFKHTINKGDVTKMQQEQTLWVSNNYNGDVKAATWTQVTIPNYPTGKDWTYVESGAINLPASMLGQSNVVFAFKYTCTDQSSGNWQIQNLEVKSDGGKLAAGGATPDPTPVEPNPTPVAGSQLFPGSDFNDWNAFLGSLNSYGLNFAKESTNGGVDGSGALHLSGTSPADKNGYIFTAMVPEGVDMTKVKKITFYVKGTSAKSLSINVYNTNSNITFTDFNGATKPAGYICFNAEDVNGAKVLAGNTGNKYEGTINASDWVKITLDLTAAIDGQQMVLPTTVGKDLIAFKFGKGAAYDLYIDNISFE